MNSAHALGAGLKAAHGHRSAKGFTTAWTVRFDEFATRRRLLHIPVEGFMYPNEVELQWSVLIVLYPFITGLVAGAFILASLERVFRVQAVKPTYRLALRHGALVSAGGPAPAATASRSSRTLARNVSDPAPLFCHGDVRLRVLSGTDGCAAAGNLARLRRDIVQKSQSSTGLTRLIYRVLTLGSDNLSERSLPSTNAWAISSP